MKVYQRIRNLREDADFTQFQMAYFLHCAQQTYSDYERGKHDIPTDILISLANIHNTSVDYLLDLTDEKKPYKRKTRKKS